MPVDFSTCASRALKYAAALSVENRAKLVLLNIMLEGPGATGSPGSSDEEHCRRLERRGKRRVQEWVKGQLRPPPEFETVIWAGIPSAYAVPLEAKLSKADLIVMPVRKASNSASSARRSITDIILRSASCPILSIQERIP
jgi:nucleotide-binding universal stress UspA family protein